MSICLKATKIRRQIRLLVSMMIFTSTVQVYAQENSEQVFLPGFNIDVYNTLRFDYYDSSGPSTGSTLPFEGDEYFNEFSVTFYKQDRTYANWRGQIFGLINDNDYRSADDGFVPERLNLTREAGDGKIPYRLEAGDYFSYFSYMTQQRSLKGFQLELQPRFDDNINSFIVFAGVNEPSWRDVTLHDDYSIGASYLLNTKKLGTWSFNTVFNSRDQDTAMALGNRDQIVTSAAWQREFLAGSQTLTIEGEAAHFSGDHNGSLGSTDGSNKSGTGYFLELSGESNLSPLDYRFRAERYNDDFQPRGAVVSPDRRSLEIFSGWRFDSGMYLRGRLLAFDDGFQSPNELETRTAGINVSGPILTELVDNLSGSFDVFLQDQEDENDSTDQDTFNITAEFNKPLSRNWFGRLGLFLQDTEDHTVANLDSEVFQVSVSGDRAFNLGGFSGVITPGILVRLLRDSSPESDEFQPTLAFRLIRDSHSIGFNYGLLTQNRNNGGTDIDTHTIAADYRYQKGQNTFGAEFSFNGRHPDPGSNTDDWSVGLFWTHAFNRSAKQPQIFDAIIPQTATFNSIDVYNIAPEISLSNTIKRLTELGLSKGYRQGYSRVWDYRILPKIQNRQRFALYADNDNVQYSALIIDFDNLGNVNSIEQTFEKVRKSLIDRYGSPTNFYEEGEFSSQFISDVNGQRFIRVLEWQTQYGIVRFGIPRRLDGQVRMEIQHRQRFLPPKNTLWSIEDVR